MELLKETFPKITRIAVLLDPAVVASTDSVNDVEIGRHVGLQALILEVRGPKELESAFKTAIEKRVGAVLIRAHPLFSVNRKSVVDLAAKTRLPAMYPWKEFVQAGGLMTYGPNLQDLYRRAATYVDKILKGSKPADLPVEQPTKFELLINLKTAKALGLTIPPVVMMRAEKVVKWGSTMAEPYKRPVTIEELLVSSLAQTDALAKLLIEKGLLVSPFSRVNISRTVSGQWRKTVSREMT
jgi:putative tryptophan/tyrosine transport system substrate-binding protein